MREDISIECVQLINWSAMWPKIAETYIECVKKSKGMDFLKLTSTVLFGDEERKSTVSLSKNLQTFVANASVNVALKITEFNRDETESDRGECGKNFPIGTHFRLDTVHLENGNYLVIPIEEKYNETYSATPGMVHSIFPQ
jgi:hypothetical protein